jgi:hypothetical protein
MIMIWIWFDREKIGDCDCIMIDCKWSDISTLKKAWVLAWVWVFSEAVGNLENN